MTTRSAADNWAPGDPTFADRPYLRSLIALVADEVERRLKRNRS